MSLRPSHRQGRRARGFQPPAFVPRSILSATPMTLGPWSFRPGERFGSTSCRRAESASRCPSTAPTRPRSRRAARSAGSSVGDMSCLRQAPTVAGDTPCSFARLPRAEALSDIASRRPRPGLTTPLRGWRCATVDDRGGLLAGALDALDLHRFTVARRSDVTLAMHAGSRARFDLTVLRDDGRRVACECGETGAVSSTAPEPGRLLCRGPSPGLHGRSLQAVLLVREITSTVLTISGSRTAKAGAGRSVRLEARTTPAPGGGVVRMQINRFDPLEGWQFSRIIRVRVGFGGVAAVHWTPPSVGRWEVRAAYRGTQRSSQSRSNVARLFVG